MKRLAFTFAAVTAAVVTGLAGGAHASGQRLDTAFRSRSLGSTLRFEVYLPAGYATSGRRYPVLYFLHGLPAGPLGYRGAGFVERALDRTGRAAIVVAPQGSLRPNGDPEYLGAWERALAEELPHVVDARYPTIANRSGRALIGVSAGGYGATLLGLHHLGSFAVVESWSGYFHPTTPDGSEPLDLGSQARNAHASAHTYVRALEHAQRTEPTFFAFYVGRDDDRFRDENEQLNQELTAAGVPHVFRVYPGGHEQSLWSAKAPAWLTLALNHLASS